MTDPIITINDLDGSAVHCIDHGPAHEVRGRYAEGHPVVALIGDALTNGGYSEDTYEIDGEEFTTAVIVSEQ